MSILMNSVGDTAGGEPQPRPSVQAPAAAKTSPGRGLRRIDDAVRSFAGSVAVIAADFFLTRLMISWWY